MTIPETLAFVRLYNRWRRGDEQYGESIEMPHPKMIGEALDALCDEVERLSAYPQKLSDAIAAHAALSVENAKLRRSLSDAMFQLGYNP